MAAGHQLHRLAVRRVHRDRPMMRPIQAHELGKHVRVTGIALRTRR
jgi:hypothetical protein